MADPDLRDPLPTFSGYETLEKLGEGGMCAVFRVRGPTGEVAVKVLTDETRSAAERFAAEARMLQGIRHPNVLVVHELHGQSRPPWIVMELLAGRDLEEQRVAEGGVDPEVAARWFADLASGLALVHRQGVRHRDIKPANIMLGRDGVPRLIDFGIARQTSQAHVTRQGFVLGTASYLPPEIFLDNDSRSIQDSEAADVYALGQTLYEVLTGEPLHPRLEGGEQMVLAKIMKDKIARPHLDPRDRRPSIPEGLAAVVRRATAQEPDDRTPSADALETALRSWLTSRSLSEVAPLTSFRAEDLPAPPATMSSPPRLADRAVNRRSVDGATAPAPVGRVATGAAGAAGFVGLGIVAMTAAVAAIGGVLVLALFAPTPLANQASKVVAEQHHRLAACRAGADGDLSVVVKRTNGAVTTKATGSKVPEATRRCIERALVDGDWPTGSWQIEVPIRFE